MQEIGVNQLTERKQMKATKILENEIKDIRISSLPSRPNSEASMGGRSYSAAEMKAAFDRLPLFIIDRFNQLIDDISASPEESITREIKTGLGDDKSLYDLLLDLKNGRALSYIGTGEESLATLLADICERLTALEEKHEQN